jgi:hypothetical protein
MKTTVNLLASSLLLAVIALLPATVRAESAAPLFDKAKKIVERIQDLDLMQRNIEECYQAGDRASAVASQSAHPGRNHAGLDGKLLNRVFGHLAGTSEYERFFSAYRSLMEHPDYRRVHSDALFAEYMRLLESGRIRLLSQLKECQDNLPEKGSTQGREALAEPIPVKTVTLENGEDSQRAESGRVVAAIELHIQVPSNRSKPLTMGQKRTLKIVVRGMEQSSSVSVATLATDVVELDILVVQERAVPLEEVALGYRHCLVKEILYRARTNPQVSDAAEKGVTARAQ